MSRDQSGVEVMSVGEDGSCYAREKQRRRGCTHYRSSSNSTGGCSKGNAEEEKLGCNNRRSPLALPRLFQQEMNPTLATVETAKTTSKTKPPPRALHPQHRRRGQLRLLHRTSPCLQGRIPFSHLQETPCRQWHNRTWMAIRTGTCHASC